MTAAPARNASRWFLSTVVLAGCVATGGAAVAARGHGPPPTGLRTVAFDKAPPDFGFALDGDEERLSGLVGKPVVLNFWATWCHPCLDEIGAFANLQSTYGDAVGLVTLSAEPAGTARAYLKAHHIDLPLVEDPEKKIFGAYSVGPIPVTIVLRRNGTVADVVIGELKWEELKAAVDAQLGA